MKGSKNAFYIDRDYREQKYYKAKLNNYNPCNECIHKCKGKVQPIIDKENGIYQICSNFNNGSKEV